MMLFVLLLAGGILLQESKSIKQKLVFTGSEEGKLLALRQSFSECENMVDDFRAGKTWVLIATNVIARGMDFKGVNCVINYDFPDSAAAYIHRIANLMVGSGCEVPSWIMALAKLKGKKHRPQRDSISTKPKDAGE